MLTHVATGFEANEPAGQQTPTRRLGAARSKKGRCDRPINPHGELAMLAPRLGGIRALPAQFLSVRRRV